MTKDAIVRELPRFRVKPTDVSKLVGKKVNNRIKVLEF